MNTSLDKGENEPVFLIGELLFAWQTLLVD